MKAQGTGGALSAETFLATVEAAVKRDGMAVLLSLADAAEKLSWRYFFAASRVEGRAETAESRRRYGRMSVRQARRVVAEVLAEIMERTAGAPYRLDVPGMGPLFEENALAAAAGESCEYGGPDEPTWPAASDQKAVAA
jgi:hypothetical protein